MSGTRRARFRCTQCGRCCREINIPVAHSDILRWRDEERFDILFEISWINNFPKSGTGGFYIRETCKRGKGGGKNPCPFLRDRGGLAFCSINDTKPLSCADFPNWYEKPDVCPEWKFPLPEKKRKRIVQRQEIDFRKAFDDRDDLLTVLFEARSRLRNGN